MPRPVVEHPNVRQCHWNDHDSHSPSVSMLATLFRMTQRRGVAPLYAGFKADAISTLLSSFIYFYLYSALHKLALRRKTSPPVVSSPAGIGGMTADNGVSTKPHAGGVGKLGPLEELLIGLVSGVISKGAVLPISAVCVRQQLASDDGEAKGKGRSANVEAETSVLGTLRKIQQEEGVLGLWSALPPSIPLALLPSLTLYVHQVLLRLLVPARHRAHPPGYITFLIGAMSNALATIPLYPMIIVKVLSQSGTYKGGRVETLKRIVHERGVAGLYQGIEGQLVKGFVQQGVMMLLKQR